MDPLPKKGEAHHRRSASLGFSGDMSGDESGYLSKSGSDSENPAGPVYQGKVYHVGQSISGRYFCKARYLRISGKLIEMFRKDPASNLEEKPIRRGVAGLLLTVEDLGRRKINSKDLFVLGIYNRVNDSRKGEIGCSTAEAAQAWIIAFQEAKRVAELEFQKGSSFSLIEQDEFKLDKHRHHVRHRAHRITKLITIGKGSTRALKALSPSRTDDDQGTDIHDHHEWRCVCTTNGIRILEDATALNAEKLVIMKSVGVVEATPSAVFDALTNVDDHRRKEWDILTGNLNLIERIDGHLDIVHGSFDPKYLERWRSKRDFVVRRQWRSDPDGSYSIIQVSAAHKGCPPKSGYRRIELNPCFWEIKPVKPRSGVGPLCSLVLQTMEIKSTGWGRWRAKYYSKFERTIPFVLLSQVAGLRDYFAANPGLGQDVSTQTISRLTVASESSSCVGNQKEEFYDAIASEMLTEDDEDSDSESEKLKKASTDNYKNLEWSVILSISKKRLAEELVLDHPPSAIDINQFKGSLRASISNKDSNCWMDPGGSNFMVRGKTYNKDYLKVPAGNPMMKLLAVDWFKSERKMEFVATHPDCLVWTEPASKLPFILVINLQVPSNPNYSLVFYFAADRPLRKDSLLERFANGDDAFRDSRFKLIPSIVEGYWVVKRAVGTKACLLGKAVNCNYYRKNNILEIDVDIGSSSVARSVISLVLGYVTSLVVDLAILIEGREQEDLPEYLLGTLRIKNIKPESAVPFWTDM